MSSLGDEMYYTMEPEKVVMMIDVCYDGADDGDYPDVHHGEDD